MMEVEYKNHRTITAPAGKLGIVIDKSIGGPIVKRVNETSPLFGQLFVGDKVLALNHQSTESMTADSIKTFLMEHADQERIFKVCTPVSTVRTVIAPAGPLGIVIDKNATITNVKETSVLKDKIFVGDKIIKIDDMNADGMTSANISEYLMKNSAKEQRILTVIKLPPPPQMEKVTIIAPSGKLGIVIERTSESGPRIKTINEKSPLYNQLVVGDQIMSIDDQNTENMTSAMVSDYLLKHMEQEERVIVVQRIKKQEIPEVDEKSEEATSVTVDADGSLATAGETRTVVTPAGKLGVVIDRTSIGLVIQKINPGSPLEGQLYVGDRIISIDEVDASSMTTASFQSYMVKTVDSERTLIVTSSSYNIPSSS
jgi:C-terminal processing protease CtpA/Prc